MCLHGNYMYCHCYQLEAVAYSEISEEDGHVLFQARPSARLQSVARARLRCASIFGNARLSCASTFSLRTKYHAHRQNFVEVPYFHRWASLTKILVPLILIRYFINLVPLTASPLT